MVNFLTVNTLSMIQPEQPWYGLYSSRFQPEHSNLYAMALLGSFPSVTPKPPS